MNVTTTLEPHDGSAPGAQNSIKLHKTDHINLMEEIGFEAQKDPLLYVFVTVFSVDRAQITIGFEFCIGS